MKPLTTPAAITAPANLNIFVIIPKTIPSLLLSKADDVIEFEKPVIGINVPAPEN